MWVTRSWRICWIWCSSASRFFTSSSRTWRWKRSSTSGMTRLEAYVSKGGAYTSGVIPEVEDLFQRQVRELDMKKREALLHQIQQILHDRVTHIPIYELA